MLLFINFGKIFILKFLNVLDIELKEDLDTDKPENFNVNVQTYLAFEREYEEFIIIKVNFNIIRKDSEEYLYEENDFYLEFNNIGYNDIIQINCIYNCCRFHLGFKIINNFFNNV